MKLFSELARRSSAGFFAVGNDHDDTRLVTIIEYLGSLLYGGGQWSLASRRQSIHRLHDRHCGMRQRRKVQLNIALVVRTWTESDEPHPTKPSGAG